MTGFDFARILEEHPPELLTNVNGLSMPDALRWYHRNGYHVWPAWPRGGLAGLAPGYHFDALERLTAADVEQLAEHWNPRWHLAMIMGAASGLWAIDADDLEQGERFCKEHEPDPTAYQVTGSGKWHMVYRRRDGDNLVMRQGVWSSDYPDIEVKTAALITVAPSLHYKTGQPYQWSDGREPEEASWQMLRSRRESIRAEMVSAERLKVEISREARRQADAEEYAAATGPRRIMSWAEVEAQPKPVWIKPGLLTQGVYGLAGPPEAGKSLLVRNWLCESAADGVNVLYAPTEGQFDMAARFEAHPLYRAARPRLAVLPEDAPLSLASHDDVSWLIAQCKAGGVRLLAFDMVYGHGLADDTGTGDVAPVLAGCKRLAAELAAAVLITGHPGHETRRRFRGSSMWRGAFDGEFHMADGQFTCEKHKYADKRPLAAPYIVEYPHLRVLAQMESAGRESVRMAAITQDLRLHPGDTDAARGARLASELGVSADYARKLVKTVRSMPEAG